MDILQLYSRVPDYMHSNPAGAAALAIILLFLIYRKPKFFFTLVAIAVAGVFISVLFEKLSAAMKTGKLPFLN